MGKHETDVKNFLLAQKKVYPIDRLVSPVQKFIQHEKSGGIALGCSVILALVLANSPWSEAYFSFWQHDFGFVFDGETYLEISIHHWINDGLMAVFFFVVGLELKREIVAGELSNLRKSILPIGAAVGGMVMPALIYLMFNPSGEAQNGWAIPMATDIAFALGVLYILGSKIPMSLKVFLTALAIVDDMGAVVVIALFYTSDISFLSLFIGLAWAGVMYGASRIGVRSTYFYATVGILGVWLAFLLSGVHATIAAVIAAFTIPADVRIKEHPYLMKIQSYLRRFRMLDPNDDIPTLTKDQLHILDEVKRDTDDAIPPLQKLEHALHPLVTFVIIPIFALANAGIAFGSDFLGLLTQDITLGVGLGLLAGKVVGIVGFTVILVKLRVASLPLGMNFYNLFGVGLLGSIGFTMSLFISSLAFTDPTHHVEAKVGIFTASLIGGTLGYFLLSRCAKQSGGTTT